METAGGRPLIFAFFVNDVPIKSTSPDGDVTETTTLAGKLLGKALRGCLRRQTGPRASRRGRRRETRAWAHARNQARPCRHAGSGRAALRCEIFKRERHPLRRL